MANSSVTAPGFMLYDERLGQLELLTDTQAGRVMKAVGTYKRTGEFANLSKIEYLVFMGIMSDIDRGMAKYEAVCQRNRKNGSKRGGARQPDPSEAGEAQWPPPGPSGA